MTFFLHEGRRTKDEERRPKTRRPFLRTPYSVLRTPRSRGFTLVETIVSLGVFSIVAVVALGALVKIIDANKKAQTLQSSITNLNFAVESMSRELRTGSTYYCDANFGGILNVSAMNNARTCDIGEGSTQNPHLLAFFSSQSALKADNSGKTCQLAYAYLFKVDTGVLILEKASQSACEDVLGSDAPFAPIISPNVTITDYRLGVMQPTIAGRTPYPLAFIRISGYSGVTERDKSYFDVQTSVSARIP